MSQQSNLESQYLQGPSRGEIFVENTQVKEKAPPGPASSSKSLHKPPSERGCVEDQPQRVATFGVAAVGAPLPRTQPRSVCQSVHGPNACERNRKMALHEPGRLGSASGRTEKMCADSLASWSAVAVTPLWHAVAGLFRKSNVIRKRRRASRAAALLATSVRYETCELR